MILNAHGIELPEEEEKVRYEADDTPNLDSKYEVVDWGANYLNWDGEKDSAEANPIAYCEDQDSANLVCFALNMLNAAQKRANARGNKL